jgi:hypothetical protein
MARTFRQKQAFVSELRDGAMRLGAILGLMGGVWWGFKHPEHVSSCSTHGPASTLLAHCTSHALTTVVVHWALILSIGFGIGGLLGVAVATLIPRPTRA